MTTQEVGIYTEDGLEVLRSTDERLRFELVDGELVVTPSPGVPHQLAPVLPVEVLSPTTRRVDLVVKKHRLERAGVPAYWVVDPLVPSLLARQLREGRYAWLPGSRAGPGCGCRSRSRSRSCRRSSSPGVDPAQRTAPGNASR